MPAGTGAWDNATHGWRKVWKDVHDLLELGQVGSSRLSASELRMRMQDWFTRSGDMGEGLQLAYLLI